jgi:hypothetical protein
MDFLLNSQRFFIFELIKNAKMKVLLDSKDSKALHLMEVLKGLSYVKATPISAEKARLISEMKEAIDNLKLVKDGKMQARSAKDLMNEL